MKRVLLKTALAFLVTALLLVPVMAVIGMAEYAEGDGWVNTNKNAPSDYAFSIAVIGDTQTLVEMDAKDGTSYTSAIYDWIVANKDAKKMQYVFGLGDITQNNTDAEWAYAKSQITKMNGVVPYTLVKGALPHDGEDQFNKYFASEEGYTSNLKGYYKEGSVANTYSTFTFGETKYLVLSLDFAAVDEVLEWAGEVIESPEFSDHRVIVTTHCYLWKDGTTADQNEPTTALPDKKEYTSDDKYNNGDEMWDKFVSKHENIFLVLSGHFESNDIIASQARGDNGNVVTQMMINPQGFDYKQGGKTGMVCMLYFSEDGSQMSVEWYSTYRNQYFKDVNQFDVSLNEMSLGEGVITEYGLIPARSYDPENYPYALFKKSPSQVNGVNYEYTFYACYKTLMGNAAGDITAYHEARMNLGAAADGAVILMLRDVENTDSQPYSNLQYHSGALTLDLGGHKMIDAHTYSTGLIYAYMKTSDNMMKFTVKNGDIVMDDGILVSWGQKSSLTNCGIDITFRDVDFSFAEGSTASCFVAKYSSGGYADKIPVTFDGCAFDMANAKDGFRFSAAGHTGSVTVKNSEIINSKYTYNVNEYGYANKKPAEDEHLAVYKDTPSSVSADGATFVSDYTFYGYYKALYSNSALGVTTVTGAFHAMRTVTEGGNDATLILLSDHEVTSDADYSNFYYHVKDSTIDLRGYTLTDSNTHNATIFNINVKNTTTIKTTITVKNGNFVLGSDDLTNYSNTTRSSTIRIVFDGVNFSWKDGGGFAAAFVGTTADRHKHPVTFKNCVIDLKNAKSGMKLEAGGSLNGITFDNTVIINSKSLNTADESDLLDGSYVIGKYGPVPTLAADTELYPFVSFKKADTTIDGITYSYTFYKAYKVLTGDSAVGVTEDTELGFSALRYAGNGALLLMQRDYTYTADKNYTNLCYSGAEVSFDLGGFTLTVADKHNTSLFQNHLKYGNENVTLTVKNGNIVLSSKGLVSYDVWDGAIGSSTLRMVFDSVNVSFVEGATAKNIIGKFAKNAAGLYFVSFKNCVIDLKNVPSGFNFTSRDSVKGGIEVDFTDTEIINSKALAPKNNVSLYTDFVYTVFVPTVTANTYLTVADVTLGNAKFGLDAVETVTIDGVSYYKISVHIAPEAAAEVYTLAVGVSYAYTYSDGTTESIPTTLEWEVSIISYLCELVADADASVSALAKDMLSYIRAAYVYDNTSAALEEIKAQIGSVIGEGYDALNMPTIGEAKSDTDGMDGAQLLLGSAPAFIFYPKTNGDGSLVYAAERYVFALDGKYRLDTTVGTDAEGKTYILVTLPAWATDNDVEYVVTDTAIHGCYNIYSYYENALGIGDTGLISLIERLCKYAEAAEAYKNAKA